MTELRSYLSFVNNYYGLFMPTFAGISHPLNDLLKKPVLGIVQTLCEGCLGIEKSIDFSPSPGTL